MPPTFYMVPQSLRRNATQGARQGEGSRQCRRNANLATPFPTNHRGPLPACRNAIIPTPPTFYMVPHKVRRNANLLAHQREGPFPVCRNATVTTLSPTNHRGPNISRRNALMASPPPNLGQQARAAMPKPNRPNNNDQRPVEER